MKKLLSVFAVLLTATALLTLSSCAKAELNTTNGSVADEFVSEAESEETDPENTSHSVENSDLSTAAVGHINLEHPNYTTDEINKDGVSGYVISMNETKLGTAKIFLVAAPKDADHSPWNDTELTGLSSDTFFINTLMLRYIGQNNDIAADDYSVTAEGAQAVSFADDDYEYTILLVDSTGLRTAEYLNAYDAILASVRFVDEVDTSGIEGA